MRAFRTEETPKASPKRKSCKWRLSHRKVLMLDDPCISDLPLPLEEPAMATGEQGTQETLTTMPSSPLWAFQPSQALAARCMRSEVDEPGVLK